MKKRYGFIVFLVLMAVGFSCSDKSTYPVDFDQLNNSNGGVLSQVNVISVAFDKFNIPGAKYELVLEANDRDRGRLFTSVDVFVRFTDRTPTSANGNNSKAEVKLKTYQNAEFVNDATTGLPRLTVSITAPETLTALGLVAGELEGSDQFVYRQAMNFPDGRVFSSDNVNTAIASGGGVYKSPFQNVVPVVCPSDIGGSISYNTVVSTPIRPACQPSVSGTTTWTVKGPGAYDIADASFGQYVCAYNVNPATGITLNDACNNLSLSGSDQYGLVWTWVITSNTGTVLTISWDNGDGDTGTTTLQRTGKTWPAGLTF